jgi:hypothetical protein
MKDQQTAQRFTELRSTGVSFARLQSMAEQLRRRLDRECASTCFSAGVELFRDDETRPAVLDWHA